MKVLALRVAAVFTIAFSAAAANAANVSYTMIVDPGGTFDVFASASLGDNAGIAGYGVPLSGGITSVDHNSPFGSFATGGPGNGPIGLSLFRSDDDVTSLAAAQDTVSPTPYLIYGFGQTAGDLSTFPGLGGIFGDSQQLAYGAPLLIASGTWDGTTPGFGAPVETNVFVDNQSAATMAALVSTSVQAVPEPASIVMLAMGGVGLLVWRSIRVSLKKSMCKRLLFFTPALVFAAFILSVPQSSFAQLRIATYNTTNGPRADSGTVFEAMGTEVVNGIAKPVDVLILQEQGNVATTTQAFVDLLNGIYGAGTYARGTVNGITSGGGRPGVIYNTNSVQLLQEVAFGTVDTSNQARQTLRYEFRPVGYGSEADFYVYDSHYKAGTSSSDQARRLVEANAIRSNSDALGEGTHAIYAGDFNIRSSSEAMWQALTSAGAGQAFDPTNRSGSWHNNATYLDLHTQSPVNSSRFSGQVTGGMDDRFDFQLVTGEFLDNEGLSYIAGSYHTLGNNGTHFLNGELDVAQNTALPQSQLTALANSSDHLPVVADYQLPARMQVAVSNAPGQVLVGSSPQVEVTVENSANVVASIGADELDYASTLFGDVSGDFSGTTQALSGGNSHFVSLDTSTAGTKSGLVNVNSSSQAVADGSFFEGVNYEVLDHANPSFDAFTDTDSLLFDFGIIAAGSGLFSESFAITNLDSNAGFTAALDLDAILGSGDTGVLTTDLSLFSGLAAGGAHAFDVQFDTSNLGLFSASYSLSLSDEDLFGELTGMAMSIDLSGRVALGGDANLDGFVTISDFLALQNNYDQAGGWHEGDFNGDGYVTISDFLMLQNNFSGNQLDGINASNISLVAVPEPSTWVLLSLGRLFPDWTRVTSSGPVPVTSYTNYEGVRQENEGEWTGFHSVHLRILPYIESVNLFNKIDFETAQVLRMTASGKPYNINYDAYNEIAGMYICPSDDNSGRITSENNYRYNFGGSTPYGGAEKTNKQTTHDVEKNGLPALGNGAFTGGRGLSHAEFTDGLSHTAFFSERIKGSGLDPEVDLPTDADVTVMYNRQNGLVDREEMFNDCLTLELQLHPNNFMSSGRWLYGSDYSNGFPFAAYSSTMYNHVAPPNWEAVDCGNYSAIPDTPGEHAIISARSRHPGLVLVAFGDGHVSAISDSIDLQIWRALGTRNGSETVDGEY
ncbi:Uncharacterized protein SCF082_LOCUS52628 [Durusdinium trenchii]|uniref:Uncharacterized protein n=1 Tax=Durusdinium trenchii TaxID=1381693 RepID=A0ABP0SBD8_9DINO